MEAGKLGLGGFLKEISAHRNYTVLHYSRAAD